LVERLVWDQEVAGSNPVTPILPLLRPNLRSVVVCDATTLNLSVSMKVGICTSLEHASNLAAAGFDYIEENTQGFLVPEATDDAFKLKREMASHAGLPVSAANCFLPGALKCTGPDVNLPRLMRYAETAFRRAEQTGIRTIVFDSRTARDQFTSFATDIAPLAERCGVTIVIEPLNRKECNFINSLSDGAAIVEAVNHPHLRLLADLYHMSVEQEAPEEIIKHGHLLHHVHVAELEGRLAPGSSGEDFGPYLRALKKAMYKKDISFECGWKHFPEQAAGSLEEFRRQLRHAGLIAG
jgi:sugar phosphate isomerase/epimerase